LDDGRSLYTEETAVTGCWACLRNLNEESEYAESLAASVILLWRWIASPVDISHREPSKGLHAKGTSSSLSINDTQVHNAQDNGQRYSNEGLHFKSEINKMELVNSYNFRFSRIVLILE